ncbi:helix-turn-helix transcriptional regulator [Larkinella soli]|uniref:helix-turn-helix transcriptional regulator n=1 Tax=Larkinella soli TaxID=1770527 RepID=UPI000FFBD439|nr:AraC family transcriptional regulator [Larkinella soli]
MLTTEEIEHTLHEAYRVNRPAVYRFEDPAIGRVEVEIEEVTGATLIHHRTVTEKCRLRVPLQRPEPMVLMFFQLEGGAHFHQQQDFKVPALHHSLNFMPALQSTYLVGEHSRVLDLTIKFRPREVAARLLEEGIPDDSWLRLLEGADQPFITLHESRKMNAFMADTARRILDCPYKGRLGRSYKEGLTRALLIDQLSTFRTVRDSRDARLNPRDIETLHELKRYLEEHFLDDLSLDALARLYGLNTFKLKYGFRKLFGMPVMRFLDDRKMTFARQLLRDGKQEPCDIADLLGYTHYSNFSAAFRRRFGYAPSVLRAEPSPPFQKRLSA